MTKNVIMMGKGKGFVSMTNKEAAVLAAVKGNMNRGKHEGMAYSTTVAKATGMTEKQVRGVVMSMMRKGLVARECFRYTDFQMYKPLV